MLKLPLNLILNLCNELEGVLISKVRYYDFLYICLIKNEKESRLILVDAIRFRLLNNSVRKYYLLHKIVDISCCLRSIQLRYYIEHEVISFHTTYVTYKKLLELKPNDYLDEYNHYIEGLFELIKELTIAEQNYKSSTHIYELDPKKRNKSKHFKNYKRDLDLLKNLSTKIKQQLEGYPIDA